MISGFVSSKLIEALLFRIYFTTPSMGMALSILPQAIMECSHSINDVAAWSWLMAPPALVMESPTTAAGMLHILG